MNHQLIWAANNNQFEMLDIVIKFYIATILDEDKIKMTKFPNISLTHRSVPLKHDSINKLDIDFAWKRAVIQYQIHGNNIEIIELLVQHISESQRKLSLKLAISRKLSELENIIKNC